MPLAVPLLFLRYTLLLCPFLSLPFPSLFSFIHNQLTIVIGRESQPAITHLHSHSLQHKLREQQNPETVATSNNTLTEWQQQSRTGKKKRAGRQARENMRRPFRHPPNKKRDLFDGLPDDILVFILSKLSSSASSPSDFINILSTCKRLNHLGLHRLVLSKAAPKVFAIKAKNWSESAHRFLKNCVNAGNLDASYTLGMIRFYCLQNRESGLSLMAKAAMKSHAPALYSLAVIQFNGSGGTKGDKDLRAGVALCARASLLGHIDALRELGHCLQDGYGVRQNVAEGRRLLIQANARELAFVLRAVARASPTRSSSSLLTWRALRQNQSSAAVCPLLSDYGYSVAVPEVQPANWFLREWFESGRGGFENGLRLCAHIGCGRPETRPHEFRRCSVCGKVNYCSRGCQALDWKLRHKMECSPAEMWDEAEEEENGGDEVVVGGGGGGDDAGNNVVVRNDVV